jgi:hypothetical protein
LTISCNPPICARDTLMQAQTLEPRIEHEDFDKSPRLRPVLEYVSRESSASLPLTSDLTGMTGRLRSPGFEVAFQPFEKEYTRNDGSRLSVLIGGAAFGEPRDQAVSFVIDLTERKRAEEALRELLSDLARMNRVSVMGELTASLAHEITQIATARNNARAARIS